MNYITIHRAMKWRGKALPREVSLNGVMLPYVCRKEGRDWVAIFKDKGNEVEVGRGTFRDMEYLIGKHRRGE